MSINFKSCRTREEIGGESVIRYAVESKQVGHEATFLHQRGKRRWLYRWCKGSTAEGYGERIALKELFELLENRKSEREGTIYCTNAEN